MLDRVVSHGRAVMRLGRDAEDLRLLGPDQLLVVGVAVLRRDAVPLAELVEHIAAHVGAGHQVGAGAGLVPGGVGVGQDSAAPAGDLVVDECPHPSAPDECCPVGVHEPLSFETGDSVPNARNALHRRV